MSKTCFGPLVHACALTRSRFLWFDPWHPPEVDCPERRGENSGASAGPRFVGPPLGGLWPRSRCGGSWGCPRATPGPPLPSP
eukprot:12737413-Alexandrium_andersonii.AAC.1